MSNRHIPFFSFDAMLDPLKEEMMHAFSSFYDTKWFVHGKGLERFEKAWAAYISVQHAVGVANGLEAIILALKALDIGPDDEVIVPSNTYIATWLAVTAVGAEIVAVEPDSQSYNITAEGISEHLNRATKCVIPVHLYGQACEMDDIMNLASLYGLYVVEDNAQSQGAMSNGQKTGSFGEINAVSFYPAKNLGAFGEAGAITTNNEQLAEKVNILRNYGSNKKYHNEVLGRNDRMDELQAWLLEVKLPYLDIWNAERQKIASIYDNLLNALDQVTTPWVAPSVTSVYHQYVMRTSKRDELQQYLKANGIGTLIHYPIPPHLQKAYAYLGFKMGDLPIAENMARTCLSLPIYPGLSETDQEYIGEKIKDFFQGN